MKRRLGVYSDQQYRELEECIGKEAGSRLDRRRLLIELNEIVSASGKSPRQTTPARLWAETVQTDPGHQEMATAFLALAEAPDPLARGAAPSHVRAQLGAKIRTRWQARWRRAGRSDIPGLSTVIWTTITEVERDEVRQMARELAAFHRMQVRRGQPRKADLDTAMLEIADIWISHTGFSRHPRNLPWAPASRFIQFASMVLTPLAPPGSSNPGSLSQRWHRMWKDEDESSS